MERQHNPMPIIRTIKMMEGETLEVQWQPRDGTGLHIERYTIPPKATRLTRIAIPDLDPAAPAATPAATPATE